MNLPPLPEPGIHPDEALDMGLESVPYFTADQVRQAQREAVAAAVPEWMPIESAPKDGTAFRAYADELIDIDFNPNGSVECAWDGEEIIGCVWNGQQDAWIGMPIFPTHWMPLPPPPTKQAPEGCETCADSCRSVELGRDCPAVDFEVAK